MTRVDFLNLKRINAACADELRAAFDAVLESGWYVLGEQLRAFEEEFAAWCGVRHCVGVANGLDALVLMLQALGVGEGDEVIVPANTYIATWLAASAVGARPVPVEPEARTFNIDPQRVEDAITPRTRAVLAVHLYGQAANMQALQEICERRGIVLLEDAAQAHGARHHGRLAGTLGRAAGFSFYPGKNLGALGDGGAVTTADDSIAEKVRVLRNYGSRVKYHNEVRGVNSRLDELQAALLRVRLRRLQGENEKRQAIAARYGRELAGMPGLALPEVAAGNESVWHLYVVRSAQRDLLQRLLGEAGIGTLIHYPVAPHRQPAYADLGLGEGALPLSEQMHREVLSLPMDPYMTMEEVEAVIAAVRTCAPRCAG
jgi:dTDP-4-amino-4,6-dideoxygalactose transaminase